MRKPVSLGRLLPLYAFVLMGCLLAAHFGSLAVTTMVESATVKDRVCFIIDAGHGGIDGGATSCTGIPESELNLQIALRLNDLLHFMGYDTIMIRTTDTSIYTEGKTIAAQKVSDLKERVRRVNETENGVLISIHQNTFPDNRYHGVQVFYAGDDTSKALAKSLQSALIHALDPQSNRNCKPSTGIYLMQTIQKPGVLIECGFLTNPEEEALLRTSAYQKKLVSVIGASLSRFFC